MKIYNKGQRTIRHAEDTNDMGVVIKECLAAPGAFFQVSDTLGRKLKKMYPRELETFEDQQKRFDDQGSAPAAAPASASPTVSDAAPPSGGKLDDDDFEANMRVISAEEAAEALASGLSVADLRSKKAMK